MLTDCLTQIISEKHYNRAQTVSTAANVVIQMAYDVTMVSDLSRRLIKSAIKSQAEEVAERGHGCMTATINIRRFHLEVACSINKLGSGWGTKMPMLELRGIVSTAIRLLFACRPEDLFGFLKGIEIFEPEDADWSCAEAVIVRFYDGKDTKSKKMNQHDRSKEQQQQGKLTSETRVERPRPPKSYVLADYFMCVHWYTKRLGDRNVPLHRVTRSRGGKSETLELPRLFCGEGVYKDISITRSTISAEIKRRLMGCKAIEDGSSLQAEHLRHTALSQVYFFAPERIQEALLRSRHSYDTFLRHYHFPLPSEQRLEMEQLMKAEVSASEVQLELLLLG